MTDAHRALISSRFPQLGDIRSFQRIDGGWTCDTYEVNGEWIVQLPRNDRSRHSLEAQLELLPELARELSAQIPLPELVSTEPLIMGYRKLDGSPANDDLGIWPERLGRFLYDLHMVPPEFVGLRAVSPESVREGFRAEWARLREVGAGLLAAEELQTADGLFGGYLEDERNWRFAPCLTHGDLGPEHVLVSPSGDLIGVIDWEEAVVWDPAGDFAWWLNARPDVGERALAAYGGAPDERFRERARVLYGLMPWHEVEYGLSDGGPDFVASGLVGVRERLALVAQ